MKLQSNSKYRPRNSSNRVATAFGNKTAVPNLVV